MQAHNVQAVRFDESLTNALADSQADDRAVRALLALTQTLDIRAVATGVVSPFHAARLATLGFAALEGPFVGGQLPAEDLPSHLAEKARRELANLLPPGLATADSDAA
jgi:EAL domain-containing protein (putative c-di-GMP-specific phosphodiesterase class I)